MIMNSYTEVYNRNGIKIEVTDENEALISWDENDPELAFLEKIGEHEWKEWLEEILDYLEDK